MPRNRSEKVPHPEVDPQFHERLRLWGLYRASVGTPRSEDAYTAWSIYVDGWSKDKADAYDELDPHAYHGLIAFYIKRAKREQEQKGATQS